MRTRKKVRQYTLEGDFVAEHLDSMEAVKFMGKGHYMSINSACSYTKPNAYGFLWRYSDDKRKIGTVDDPKYNRENNIKSANNFDKDEWRRSIIC